MDKKCSLCKTYKELNNFTKCTKNKDGLCYICRDCKKIKDTLWRQANPNHFKEYYDKNKQKLLEAKRQYKRENRHKIRIKKRQYEKNKKCLDSLYKFKANIKGLLNRAFTIKHLKKSKRTQDIIGCTIEELFIHLKQTAINNYGFYDETLKYHIDHIIPLYLAKNEEQVIKLNHFSNLQYLYPEHNLKKGKSTTFTLAKNK